MFSMMVGSRTIHHQSRQVGACGRNALGIEKGHCEVAKD